MIDLGVRRSHSRPRCSNDNPYSEAQFKTLKYMPDFPDRFGSLADARVFCERFFTAYNHEHRHSGIGMHTPASVHFDTATEIQGRRQATLDRAHAQNPERFTRRPQPPRLPRAGMDQAARPTVSPVRSTVSFDLTTTAWPTTTAATTPARVTANQR